MHSSSAYSPPSGIFHMWWKMLEGDFLCPLHTYTNTGCIQSEDTVTIKQMNPNKGLQSSVNGRHWPCIESVDGLHRGTPDSGWLSAHTGPLMSPPQARGWSTTSSQLVLLSLWGCSSMISSGLRSPEGKAAKWLCIKNGYKKEPCTRSFQTAT